MSTDLAGRWALVTGAGSGIGRETAMQLAAEGANLVLADISLKGAEEAAHAASALGGEARAIRLDVGDFSQVSAEVPSASDAVGGFEYLVNAAGVFGLGAVETLQPEEIERVFRVNVYGAFYVCGAVLPGMMRARRGAIVSISSLHAQNGQPNAAHYAASKGAVIGLTKSIAREKASFGIRANAVAPGPIDTPFWRGGFDWTKLDFDSLVTERCRTIPLGRLGTPKDVSGVILFLLGPAAAYVTGQIIPVGGGEIMR